MRRKGENACLLLAAAAHITFEQKTLRISAFFLVPTAHSLGRGRMMHYACSDPDNERSHDKCT